MKMDWQRLAGLSFDYFMVLREGQIEHVSPQLEKHLGYVGGLPCRELRDLVHKDDLSAMGSLDSRSRNTIRLRTGGGTYRWFEVESDVVNHETYLAMRDITAQKTIQNDLGRYLINMRQSRDEAEQFAYAASHDLQEPLRTISNYAGFLLEDYGAVLPPDAAEQLTYIIDAAKMGRQLVNDLLAITRLKDPTIQDVDLSQVLGQVTMNLEFAIKESQALIEHGPLGTVLGDQSMLVVLLQNLVSNAIKFSDGPPAVRIGCEVLVDSWHIWVEDSGIGIDPQYVDQVFQIFRRINRDYPGTGIGLAICRKIVDLHRGKIWIDSEPGHGTVVHITLPRDTNGNKADSTDRGSSPGCPRDAEGAAQSTGFRPNSLGSGWGGSSTVLAQDGAVRGRPSTRPGSNGLEPTARDWLRAPRGNKAG